MIKNYTSSEALKNKARQYWYYKIQKSNDYTIYFNEAQNDLMALKPMRITLSFEPSITKSNGWWVIIPKSTEKQPESK